SAQSYDELEPDRGSAERHARERRRTQRRSQRRADRRAPRGTTQHHEHPKTRDDQGSSASRASVTVATPRTPSDTARTSPALRWATRGERTPSGAAGGRRDSSPAPARPPPVRPTSPSPTTWGGSGRWRYEDAAARTPARSAGGSTMRPPPATLTKTS